MNPPVRVPEITRGIRFGAVTLFAGYLALLTSVLLKDALAIAILLPLGTLLFIIGAVCWALAAYREARSKNMV